MIEEIDRYTYSKNFSEMKTILLLYDYISKVITSFDFENIYTITLNPQNKLQDLSPRTFFETEA